MTWKYVRGIIWRKSITVKAGKDFLKVKLDPCDRDLAKVNWFTHQAGYACRRTGWKIIDGKRRRPIVFLHKVIAQRMNDGVATRFVKFKNGARLDCRRSNLVIFDFERPSE